MNSDPKCGKLKRPTLRLPITIRKISVQETWESPNWPKMLGEYKGECVFEGLPPVVLNKDLYKQLERASVLHTFGAFEGPVLIGHINMMITPSTHYKCLMASTESFFVLNEYRDTGVGLKLLREAENFAKECKVGGLLVSSPKGQKLASVLERKKDYIETTRVFVKRFNYE